MMSRHRSPWSPRRWGRTLVAAVGIVLIGVAVAMVAQSWSAPAKVADQVVTASTVPTATYAPPSSTPAQGGATTESSRPTTQADRPATAGTTSSSATAPTSTSVGLPQIPAAPAVRLQVPSLGINAGVLPVDSVPTGQTNNFGGPIYQRIDFPVDSDVRQWVQRGDPNSISPARSVGQVKDFDRVILYGHASDIGNHLVFQDLSRLKLGDKIVVTTKLGVFTYQVATVATNAKGTLQDMPQLYEYPAPGRKEIALVACLPDTTSNSVVIGVLVAAKTV